MAQGEFTQEEADETLIAVEELFDALPLKKQREYIGHYNDIVLFINAAKKAAPKKETNGTEEESAGAVERNIGEKQG